MACNDYIQLDTCLYRLLQINLRQHRNYLQLLELFHEVCPAGPCSSPEPGSGQGTQRPTLSSLHQLT